MKAISVLVLLCSAGCAVSDQVSLSETPASVSANAPDGPSSTATYSARISADSLMSGAFVLDVSLDDITEPLGFGATVLGGLQLNALLLLEVEEASDEDDDLRLLLAWGQSSATARSTVSQKPTPTTSCSGSSSGGDFSGSCDGMWTDVEPMTLGGLSGADGAGATLLAPELAGSFVESGGALWIEDLQISGSLDLDTLRSELGVITPVLCLAVGGCEPCPDDGRSTCVDFTLEGLSGEQSPGLDLIAR